MSIHNFIAKTIVVISMGDLAPNLVVLCYKNEKPSIDSWKLIIDLALVCLLFISLVIGYTETASPISKDSLSSILFVSYL